MRAYSLGLHNQDILYSH